MKRGEFEYRLAHFASICEPYFRYHSYEGKKRKLPIKPIKIKSYPPVAITENLACLPGITLRQGTGHQGYRSTGGTIIQPIKKPQGAELTKSQKKANQAISKERVVVEQCIAGIKQLRILKDRICLHCYDVGDHWLCFTQSAG